jgi:hypothetical protein
MSKNKNWYEVRVREQIGPDKWRKISKFFEAEGPKEAAQKYSGVGQIMWSEKVQQEKLLGVGAFFRLGDDLLKELQQGVNTITPTREVVKNTRIKRRYYDKQRKAATD